MSSAPSIIFDCGSSWFRGGFSSQSDPQVVLPTIVGRPKDDEHIGPKSKAENTSVSTTLFIGEKALAMRDSLAIKYPVQHGYVEDWEYVELLWQDMLLEKLCCEPEHHPCLVALKEFSPSQHHERVFQILFENYGVPYVRIGSSSMLSLRASGRRTGLAVDIGESECVPSPVYDGHVLRHTMQRTMVSGRSLTTYLYALLSQKGILDPNLPMHRSYAKDIKERLCRVALDYESEVNAFQDQACFSLPDGREISIDKERMQCPEGLFQQNLLNFEMPGLGECVFRAMKACDEKIQPELFSNVVLCGGSSFLPGLSARLLKELQCLADKAGIVHHIDVSQCTHRHATFHGACLMTSDEDFLSKCVSKEFYDENGPEAARKLNIF